MVKIFLVDDHHIFRESLSLLISQEKIGEIIAEASDGKEFLEKLENCFPDLILLDIAMPVMNGAEAAKIAIEKYPDLKILTLSAFDDEKHYQKMVAAGVKGFLLKSTNIAELEQAIREVAAGGSWFSNELLRKIINRMGNTKPKSSKNLTGRETEVLMLICKGFSNEQIADELNLSYETVRSHKSKLLSKTESTNLASLVMYAIKNKLIEI